MDDKNTNTDKDKDKMKQVILDNLKRLVLLNFTQDDLAELYNKKVDKHITHYQTCSICNKLRGDVETVTITRIDDYYDNSIDHRCCHDCFRYCYYCHRHYLLQLPDDKCDKCHTFCYKCKKYYSKSKNKWCPDCKDK